MRKVIDLCLDLPPDAEFLTNTLTTFFCNPNYSGYKNSYAGPMAQQIGYTVAQLDTLAAQQGTDGFRATVAAAAAENEITGAQAEQRDLHAFLQWQNAIVLQQDRALCHRLLAQLPVGVAAGNDPVVLTQRTHGLI